MAKKFSRLIFKLSYMALALVTGLALATPPAFAANILPDTNLEAVAMIGAVAISLLVIVVEIWRQTTKTVQPNIHSKTIRRIKHR